MTSQNYYDVTDWPEGDPREDIGQVINSIIRDIKKRQTDSDATTGFGKPGATIHIPSGDWRLATQVLIDVSYLRIEGDGHGFVSSSIRYNTDEERWPDLHEIWPGGSRVMVDLPARPDTDGRAGAAFLVERDGDPRISSVEFSGFNIDGLHFVDDGGTDSNPENSYVNGRTGIYVASPCDSFRIEGMGMVYLEHGLVVRGADALSAHGNFIAECGSCIELRDWGQASKVTDNLLGAGYKGRSIYAQRFGGLLVSGNNVFPRGAESVRLDDCARCTVTGNRLHSFYPGMLDLRGRCAENLVAANHLYRAWEPWPPMQMHGNGLARRRHAQHGRGEPRVRDHRPGASRTGRRGTGGDTRLGRFGQLHRREPCGRDDGIRRDRRRGRGLVLRSAGRRDARERARGAVGHDRRQD